MLSISRCLNLLLPLAGILRTALCFQTSPSFQRQNKPLFASKAFDDDNNNNAMDPTRITDSNPSPSTSTCMDKSRRTLFQTITAGLAVTLVGSSNPSPALADDAKTATASASATSNEILLRLRSIPTFCLVNAEGVPFMIFDGQASATGYFFLSFEVASKALQDARQKDKNKGASDMWGQAKIVVVPLAVALQLALRKTQREAVNNGIKFGTYNEIVASSEGVDNAKALESVFGNEDKWAQKGRIPLFYVKGLTLANGRQPRYFNQADLTQEWTRQHPNDALPPIQLVELVDLYRKALANNELGKIANLAIVPVAETNSVAAKLLKSPDDPPPSYSFSKVFLVGSAQ